MLHIFMGYACNFKCEYCLQDPTATDAIRRQPKNASRVVDFIEKRGVKSISYWGGEPLLYLDTIKAIQDEMMRRNLKMDYIRITSNGSLMTPVIAKQLNDWNARLVVSIHDEAGAPNWLAAKQVENLGVSFLFRHDYLSPFEWLNGVRNLEVILGREIYPFMHWIRAVGGCDKSHYFTHDDLDKHEIELIRLGEMALAGDKLAWRVVKPHLDDWKHKLRVMEEGERPNPLCMAPDCIAIDMNGDSYSCHHAVRPDQKIGNEFSTIQILDKSTLEARLRASKYVNSMECMICPIRSWCRGNCHMSNTHDIDCRLSKIKHRWLSKIDESINGISIQNKIEV